MGNKNIMIHALIALLMVLGFYAIMKGRYVKKVETYKVIRTNVRNKNGMLLMQYDSEYYFLHSRYKVKLIKKGDFE